MTLRLALAYILAAGAPLLAVRQALSSLRCVSCKSRWSRFYPMPELLLALLRTSLVAVIGGTACLWLLGASDRVARVWTACGVGIPLFVGISLFFLGSVSGEGDRKGSAFATWATRVASIFVCLVAWFAFVPTTHALSEISRPFDWLTLRWAEAFLGYPCLIIGLRAQLARVEREKFQLDPRPWLLLGLLGPIGTVRAFSIGQFGLEFLLVQTVGAFMLASAIAAALLLARRAAWPAFGKTAAIALLAFASVGSAKAQDSGEAHKDSVFVSVELDVSDHPGDLRDAAAGISRSSGFEVDPRFPPRYTGEKQDRVQIWGWLPESKLDSALPGAAVERVEIERVPKETFAPIPEPDGRAHRPVDVAPASFEPPNPGFVADHLAQLLLMGFLTLLGFVILRSPKRVAKITRSLFPKKQGRG